MPARFAAAAVAVLFTFGASLCQAQNYPVRPLRFLAGYPPEQFAAWIRSEVQKWAKVVRDSGAQVD